MKKTTTMEDANNPELREASWRGRLNLADEARLQAFLASHPDARPDWREDLALTQLLHRLPNAPVSSNFTARVLQEAQRIPVRRSWVEGFVSRGWLRAGWMPRVAVCALAVCAGMISFKEHESIQQREKMARNLANVTRLATLPPVDWMKNFDTINGLSKVKVADEELLSVLQ
jgi:anti-sigma factor RsiW